MPTEFDLQSPVNMLDFFKRLFMPDFMPHGHCYFYRPDVLWLNVFSDALIAISYYVIPISLLYIVWRRKDLPFGKLLYLFGAFIVACGTTHLFEIYTVWSGMYRLEGLIKFATAGISLFTAIVLIPLLPKIVALPGLQGAIDELSRKKEALEGRNVELDTMQRMQLNREERILELKKEVNTLQVKLGKVPPYQV